LKERMGVSRPAARFLAIGMLFAYILLMEALYF